MLRAILNKSWWQHPTRHQLDDHLPPITKTIQVRRTRHAGHYWRSRGELISDVLLWTPTYGRAKAGRPARTYIQQLCEDTGCSSEDLPKAMNDREKWRERVRDIRATSTTWWWRWWSWSSLQERKKGRKRKARKIRAKTSTCSECIEETEMKIGRIKVTRVDLSQQHDLFSNCRSSYHNIQLSNVRPFFEIG